MHNALSHHVAPRSLVGPPPRPALSRRQKAAVIVRLLLREGAELRLDDLPEAMQVDLTHEMGALRSVDRTTLHQIVVEFVEDLNALGMSFPGGLSGALDTLDGVLSPACIQKLRQETGLTVRGDPWEVIAALPPSRLADVLAGESEVIAAVVLSKLPVKQSASVLAALPGDRARRITYAVSQTAGIDPSTVRSIGMAIAGQLAATVQPAFDEAPVSRVGAILNSSDAATRDDVLTGLDAEDSLFADEVRKAIFTFANIAQRIDARDVPKVARAVDQTLLITALAAAGERDAASAEFILSNMSQRLATQLREEMQELGRVKPSDGEEAKDAVVAAIRDMESAGEITFVSEDE